MGFPDQRDRTKVPNRWLHAFISFFVFCILFTAIACIDDAEVDGIPVNEIFRKQIWAHLGNAAIIGSITSFIMYKFVFWPKRKDEDSK